MIVTGGTTGSLEMAVSAIGTNFSNNSQPNDAIIRTGGSNLFIQSGGAGAAMKID